MNELLPAFRGIIGQARALARLDRAVRTAQVAHAYLFEGPAGVGKFMAARALAKALLCDEHGCNRCSACIRIDHGTHPDVAVVVPEGVTLGIDQIRDLTRQAVLTAVEGGRRIFIVDDADAMTTQAANALLRTLEEPPPGVVFILVTANVHALLPTITSRCRQVNFGAIPAADIAVLLQERFGFDADEAVLATRVSGGVAGKALAFVRGDGMQRRRDVLTLAADLGVLDSLDLMTAAQTLADTIKGGARKSGGEETARREAEELAVSRTHAAFLRRTLEQRAKRDVTQREREAFDDVLSILASWFRDVVVVAEGAPELMVNLDHREALERCAAAWSPSALDCIEAIDRARAMIRHNVSPQLAIEVMLLEVQECNQCNA